MAKTITGKPCKVCSSELRYYIGGGCINCMKRRSSERSKRNIKGVWKHRLTNINVEERIADCAQCGVTKIMKKRNGWRCKEGKYGHVRGYSREYYLRTKKARKVGDCDICKKEKPLCWDHNHKTGEHRGWLCHWCNVGIGFLNDDVDILQSAINYLKK